MLIKKLKSYISFLSAVVFASLLAGCSSWVPDSWNDPAYFGPDEDLGKDYKGVGTGYETWNSDWYKSNIDPSAD